MAGFPQPSAGARAVFVRPGLGLQAGGLTKAVLGRIRLFDSAGWSVHLALLRQDPNIDKTVAGLRANGRLPATVTVHHVARERGRRRRMVLPWSRNGDVSTVEEWLDGVAGDKGAVVFADSPAMYKLVAKMRNPRAGGIFVVNLCHLSSAASLLGDPGSIANGPLTLRWGSVSDATLRAADRIVVLTEAQARDFHLRWGADLPIDVIPHSAPAVDPMPDRGFDPRLVVGLGQLRPMKRWDDAIRVMARVIVEVPDARLVLYGAGDDRDRLLAITDELGMTSSVTFAGYTTTPLAAMAHAACTLSTTGREAMPLTLLEGLSVGTPAVVYDVRYGPRDIVRNTVDGFVVPARDIPAAARAVVRLLTEPDLRDRMSQAAREVNARFTREAHDDAWLRIGHDVHQQRRRPAPTGEEGGPQQTSGGPGLLGPVRRRHRRRRPRTPSTL